MALPMQLRIKTTSERLRTNHIDLLEYTEKLSQENEKLKSNMDKLLRSSSLPCANNTYVDDDEPKDDPEKTRMLSEMDGLRAEVVALRKKLLAGEVDIKTLKAKAQLSQPNNDERLVNLRARLDEETRIRLECAELLQGSQAETLHLQAANASLREELAVTLLKAADQERAWASVKIKEEEAAELGDKLNKILREMDGMGEYHTRCMDTMMQSFMQEMERKLADERVIQEKQIVIIDSLTEEINGLRATELQLRKGLEKSKNGLISEPKDSSCVRSCSVSDLPEFCAKCRCSLNTCDNIILAEPPETKNINFTEHVRILEENRILKIQLANANATLNSSFKLGSARQQRRPGSSAPPALLK